MVRKSTLVLALSCATLAAAASFGQEPEARPLRHLTPSKIVNGNATVTFSSTVALLDADSGVSFCTGTLVGCSTVLTAAHCVCAGDGGDCQGSGPDLLPASAVRIFAQHAGIFGVSSVKVHPDFSFGTRSDVAILTLDQPVEGIVPTHINETQRVPKGTTGQIAGFGITDGDLFDSGIKRQGLVQTATCSGVPDARNVCWNFASPLGPVGEDSNTCAGDSGGPLFVDLGQGLRVAGVTSGGSNTDCGIPDAAFDTDVFVERAWIRAMAGADLDATSCGNLPSAGSPGAQILFAEASLSAGTSTLTAELPLGTGYKRLVVTLDGEEDQDNDFDLSVDRNTLPDGENDLCNSRNPGMFEECVIENPQAGTWNLRVDRLAGAGDLQLVAVPYAASSSTACTPDAVTLCLGENDRFRVRSHWKDFEGKTGNGQAVDIGKRDSGLFYFFGPDNLEILIKVLDACVLNQRFWVFSAATTNVEYTLTVTDTQDGVTNTYFNPLGTAAPAITDTDAFATCP